MMRPDASDPTIAPAVFAAYTPPTSRPGSCPGVATAASASGKLAPHRIAPGSTTQRQRTTSSWKLYQGLVADRRVDRPVRQRGHEHVRRPAHRAAEHHLAPSQRHARPGRGARNRRPDTAADAEAEEEHAENQRERIDGRAEQQRQQPRPEDLARQRRHARNRDGDVDGRRVGRADNRSGPLLHRFVRRDLGHRQADHRDEHVQRHGHVGRDRHVVDPQQVEAGDADCPRPRRRCCRRRRSRATTRRRASSRTQRAIAGSVAPISSVGGSRHSAATIARTVMCPPPIARVNAVDERHAEQQHQTPEADAELEHGVDAQRMLARVDVPRQHEAARGTCRP